MEVLEALGVRPAVFEITYRPTGAQYVGSTNNLRLRWQRHRLDLRRGRHHNRFLQRSWLRYGERQFRLDVLEWGEAGVDLVAREQHSIDSLRPRFNLTAFAAAPGRGAKRSAAVRAQMAAARRREWDGILARRRATVQWPPPAATESTTVGAELARVVSASRASRGLTQQQFARLVGLRQSQVVRLDRGTHQPTLETLQRIAGALGLILTLTDTGSGVALHVEVPSSWSGPDG
jgi:ribosome-binding protein aMBF1 (putative translation factor)